MEDKWNQTVYKATGLQREVCRVDSSRLVSNHCHVEAKAHIHSRSRATRAELDFWLTVVLMCKWSQQEAVQCSAITESDFQWKWVISQRCWDERRSLLLGLKQYEAGWFGGRVGGWVVSDVGVLLCCDKSHVDILSPSAPGPQWQLRSSDALEKRRNDSLAASERSMGPRAIRCLGHSTLMQSEPQLTRTQPRVPHLRRGQPSPDTLGTHALQSRPPVLRDLPALHSTAGFILPGPSAMLILSDARTYLV